MIVIPKEKLLLTSVEKKTLADLAKDGWPSWLITQDCPKKPEDRTETLGKLIYHVRNAVAHGRISFTSDSPRPEEVMLLVEDKHRSEDRAPYFRAEISAIDLKVFCLRFLELIEETIG
jgi:hypothetical protein